MTLRKPRISDASSIAAISLEVWIGTYLKRGVNSFFADFALAEFTVPRTEAFLRDPREFLLVSENEEGIDGFIRLSSGRKAPVPGCSDTEITTLYVQPRHHGKGVGKSLLKAAFQHCRDNDVSSVWLATNAENAAAIGFYRARGFVQVGETHFSIQDQNYLNNVYSRQLD
ncbi:GNAT family N-acetyltransferase [Yoonia sediminilitoris]|nr:GNAT family N-acetyltransferase [Yoonia sediminilitoris]